MIRFTTESGARYVMDTDQRRVMRETGPHSAGIDYTKVPDAEWHNYLASTTPTLGKSMAFSLASGKFRITTPLVEVTEVG